MHIFFTSVSPDLRRLSNAYMNGINEIAAAQKFLQNTIDAVEAAYSVTSTIQDIAEINQLNKIDYAPLYEKFSSNAERVLQTQFEVGAKIIFEGENDYIVESIVHTTNQIITAIRNCNPATGKLDGCTGLFIDLGGDVISTFSNFVASLQLRSNTKRLDSVTCTSYYLTEYYRFGGNKKMLAESFGLSQDANNFVIEEVLAKRNVCKSSNMDYTLSLIERYQEQIRTLNSLNSISQP